MSVALLAIHADASGLCNITFLTVYSVMRVSPSYSIFSVVPLFDRYLETKVRDTKPALTCYLFGYSYKPAIPTCT